MSNTLKTYFGSRKRDFSNKKNDEDERKKAKEIILDYHWIKMMLILYLEDIDSPGSASMLYHCLKNFDKNVNQINLLSTTTSDARIKSTPELKEENDAIRFINKTFEEFEGGRREKEWEIPELKSAMV